LSVSQIDSAQITLVLCHVALIANHAPTSATIPPASERTRGSTSRPST